ncbi:MAG: hypothetical protein J6X55_00125 [Victivallales bacterium]|nr:hypothetical protein [Victivallales bacterium]
MKNFSQELWNNRITILESANCLEITHLSAEDFYTLIDFMDWEWDRHFSWKALTREQILLVAKKHPEILEKYGFEKISDKEMAQLLSASAEFMDFCLEKAKGNDDKAENIRKLLTHDTISGVLTAHPEAYPKFKSYFSLNFLDCIGFRYYGVEELRHKVAFYRLFVTQAFMFILGWWYLYYGECGYKSFRVEHPQMARMAMYGYIIYGLLWSFIQARLHEYCGKERLSRFLGIVHGCLGVMFFGYTFFLTSLTRLNYLFAIGIYSIYMFVMFFCHRHCARDLARRI